RVGASQAAMRCAFLLGGRCEKRGRLATAGNGLRSAAPHPLRLWPQKHARSPRAILRLSRLLFVTEPAVFVEAHPARSWVRAAAQPGGQRSTSAFLRLCGAIIPIG